MTTLKIGFVGTGQMATALAYGFCTSGLASAKTIVAHDIDPEAQARFSEKVGPCEFVESNSELVARANLIILAVKPQIIPTIVDQLKPFDPSTLFISVMGGITLDWLKDNLGTQRVIRTMPNTPCLIGEGATGIAVSEAVEPAEREQVKTLFESVGLAVELPERLIDAVTGISGSGPAFVFQFIEALSDGAVCSGIPRETALQLAAQTVVGAGKMVHQTGEHPGVLRDRVASPGGTTIAGLKALEEGGLRAAAMNAVVAATQRSIELGQ
ncbi:MAG: pyrroline-5-carboxylate reductase [Planctomycetota bacterium]|nr:pyrroline-5-carboxylate reductase [Planctomycetota bacterium]